MSVSSGEGQLEADLHSVQNPEWPMISIKQTQPGGPNLLSDQRPQQHIINIKLKPHLGWHTICWKWWVVNCQQWKEKDSWTLTYTLFKIHSTIVSIKEKLHPGWHTNCWKLRVARSQDQAERASWTSTYTLFKTKSTQLSALCRKGPPNPDLQAVYNQDHCILSMMWEKHPEPWLTSCLKCRQFCCQHCT